jgi:hypothetical protein
LNGKPLSAEADCKSLLGDGLSRHYLCNPCVGAWTPTPQRPFSAPARFFLKDNGLTLDVRGSARQICPCNATSTENRFSGLQSFRNVQAPALARPPGCTHRYSFKAIGRPGRLHHASPGWLPAPGCGIATYPTRVRLGGIRLDFHQLDCSLVGCSDVRSISLFGLIRGRQFVHRLARDTQFLGKAGGC